MSGERVADFRTKNDDADREFRWGLEDLVRGHIDGCMNALASCSSARATENDDETGVIVGEGAEQFVRRRRRSDLGDDDLAETSAAAHRHSRILSRWVARQAEEMITTIERRNRESELMALAGLHTVSMRDSSFLHESRLSQSSIERPVAARSSSILQRWRELEVEASRGTATSGSRNSRGSLPRENADHEFSSWAHATYDRVNRVHNDDQSSREQSPELGDAERERRVRQIARGWMTDNRMTEDTSRLPPRNDSLRAEWLGENERERVRSVREWVQMTSQQRNSRAGEREETVVVDQEENQPEHFRRDLLRFRGRQARLDLITRIARERQRELQGLSERRAVSEFPHRSRIQSFLRGRFLRNQRPEENERLPSVAARELGQLRQRHPVSGLREGFRSLLENIVRGQATVQTEGWDNGNASLNDQRNDELQMNALVNESAGSNHEHLQPPSENYETWQTLNETRPSSEFESANTTDNTNFQPLIIERDNWHERNAQHVIENRQQSSESELIAWHDGIREDSNGNWPEQMDQEWPAEALEDEEEDGEGHAAEAREWHEDDSHGAVGNWGEGPSDPSRELQSFLARSANRFILPDDDNVYSMEIRELLSRRSVSTLLGSGFRENLDRLIESYVQRQGHHMINWDVQRPSFSTPTLSERDLDQQRDAPNQEQQDPTVIRPSPIVLPSPPVPPPQPLWPSGLYRSSWNRHGLRRSEIEIDAISDLRADITRLQQGMSHMQRMLEACMDMQLELQRSVRQEVSAALNRFPNGEGTSEELVDESSIFSLVRKGTCCVCCDSHIDSLLYRCGHMCACSKCANELVRGGGKCPLCRAPIVEVIRAYSIL